MSNTSQKSRTHLLTDEQLAKIIAIATGGFVEGVMGMRCPIDPKNLYEVTLESIRDEDLHNDFIQAYDDFVKEAENG